MKNGILIRIVPLFILGILFIYSTAYTQVQAQSVEVELITRQSSKAPYNEKYLLIKREDTAGFYRLIDSIEILSLVRNFEFYLQGNYLYTFFEAGTWAAIPTINKYRIDSDTVVVIKQLQLDSLQQKICICDFNFRQDLALIQCNNKRITVNLSDLTVSVIEPGVSDN